MVWKFIKKYEKEVRNSINDLKNIKTFHRQIPNLLTFLRLVGAIPAGLLFSFNPSLSIGLISFLWFTDAIDGRIAKKFNAQSKLGADMDAFADKIMFLASSLPLMTFAPGLIFNFILEGVISLINVIGRIKGLDTKTVLSGKIKTVSLAFTLVSGYLVQYFRIPSIILNILMNLTTGLQFIAIKDYICEFIRMDKELKKEIINDNIDNINTDELIDKDDELSNDLELSKINESLYELRKERDFYIDIKENDNVSSYSRSRKIDNRKRNNIL